MPKQTKGKKKGKQAAAPYNPREQKETKGETTIFNPTKRNFGIGQAIQPRRDLGRYVKWPAYVRLQRQRKIIKMRLKVPPALNQFNLTLDKNTAVQLFRLLNRYRPEDKTEKKERLRALATAKAAGEEAPASKKPMVVKFGLNHVTALIESKKAKLVVIAADVEPIELVVWLPALCRKLDIPYCIVKGKARLGTVVHQRNAAVLAITDVRKEDQHDFQQLVQAVRVNFNELFDERRRRWGGGIMGIKSDHKTIARERVVAKEERQRANL